MNDSWQIFLSTLLKIPGAKVNREDFLHKVFPYLSDAQLRLAVDTSPIAVVSRREIDHQARRIINSASIKVSSVSAVSSIPGGYTMLATIPADTMSYYFHIVRLGQKLGYLYGYPDMLDAQGDLTAEGHVMLTAFIGVMSKVSAGQDLLKVLTTGLVKSDPQLNYSQALRQLIALPIVTTLVQKIIKKMSTKIAVSSSGQIITKAVPIVSGVINGVLTYRSFKPSAFRLEQSLRQFALRPRLTAGTVQSK